jgi:ferredoxin like protein
MNSTEKLIDKIKLDAFYVDKDFQHVGITDKSICRSKCQSKACLKLCPSEVYQWNYERSQDIVVRYEQCIECGACRIACPEQNVFFDYPRGGYGTLHRYG